MSTAAPSQTPKVVVIRSWPKMVFLWPTALIALFMGIAQASAPHLDYVWGDVFVVCLALNLVVLTFEFPRGTSFAMLMAAVAVVLGLVLLNTWLSVIDPLADLIKHRTITASTEFYISVFIVQLVLFIAMYIVTRFDYWELTANELIHHHGVLGDIERFSTAGLKMNKEISDIFEYILAGAGTVVMLMPSSPRPIVLDNVLGITRITRLADRILDARVVRVEGGAAGTNAAAFHEAEGAG